MPGMRYLCLKCSYFGFWVNGSCLVLSECTLPHFCFWSLAQGKVNARWSCFHLLCQQLKFGLPLGTHLNPQTLLLNLVYVSQYYYSSVCLLLWESLFRSHVYLCPSHQVQFTSSDVRKQEIRNHEVQQPHVFWFFFCPPVSSIVFEACSSSVYRRHKKT
jgi:hypothetical protein